ncbi:substrate-binding domain-containing protein [Sphingomonas jatrophae]|uniref:Phosphate ABC transporter substrate-binding protein, PhoT family n=1 Tax=Sphingomonas jatrophae TaxID=1166337 RepID=A0A1I6JKT0_9SPHN|nr:substrate-binding domain-containing protein [Sphingomonas jatrophae]SFR79521.1 phosphate ABC transporter substrate-binding protein, PhoT family [Sphingomonas jatrophae]
MVRRGLAGAALLALGACGGGIGEARDQIRVVGSSTVYPFTTAVAEAFARKNPGLRAPIVESTGTGAGMKLFCAGLGPQYPDIEDASRRIKKSELEDCQRNGVSEIVEVQIGIDGIALGEAVNGPKFALTERQVYEALAATPYGKPQTARRWSDIDPALPNVPIVVYGPPPTSGTRDALAELILEKGCASDPAMAALKTRDEKAYRSTCTKVREDGAYVEAGENDNLIVQKLAANPDAVGVFGYSFLEENKDRVHGIPLQGVQPSYETIANFRYPGARPLFIYVKGAHLNAIPGLKAFVAEYAKAWGHDGYLARRGLITAPADVQARNAAVAAKLTPLDPKTVS